LVICLLLNITTSEAVKLQSDFKAYQKYSPFYLRHHPEERSRGDIADIQTLAQGSVESSNDLEGVENVFEKHFDSFEHLLKKSQDKN